MNLVTSTVEKKNYDDQELLMGEIVSYQYEKVTFSLHSWLSTHDISDSLNPDELSERKIEALNFNKSELTEVLLSKVASSFKNFSELKALYFEYVDFRNNSSLFRELIREINEKEFCHWLYVRKEFLTKEQWLDLSKLCNTNQLKGLQVYAVDFPQGVVPEYFHMNQTRYNEVKTFIVDKQVRWTLEEALRRYFPNKNIENVFDFGAGLSPEILCLAKNNVELKKIVAADFDVGQLEKLRAALKSPYKEMLETFGGAFIKYNENCKFDLFLSSFTLPYRTPDQFPEVWKKAVSMTKSGGVMAFHLFGKPKNPRADLTYHRLKEIKKLLMPICSEYEILVEYPNGSCQFVYWSDGKEHTSKKTIKFEPGDFRRTDVYGGSEADWGSLFHIIAKKTFSMY